MRFAQYQQLEQGDDGGGAGEMMRGCVRVETYADVPWSVRRSSSAGWPVYWTVMPMVTSVGLGHVVTAPLAV